MSDPRRIFQTPEEMQTKIEEYFEKCDKNTKEVIGKGPEGETVVLTVLAPERYTIPDLAYYLGFSQRTQFADYAKDHPEFSDTVSRARLRIEGQRVRDGVNPDTRNSNGIKFDLTNNWDYREKSEIEHSGYIAGDEAANEAYKRRLGALNLPNSDNVVK